MTTVILGPSNMGSMPHSSPMPPELSEQDRRVTITMSNGQVVVCDLVPTDGFLLAIFTNLQSKWIDREHLIEWIQGYCQNSGDVDIRYSPVLSKKLCHDVFDRFVRSGLLNICVRKALTELQLNTDIEKVETSGYPIGNQLYESAFTIRYVATGSTATTELMNSSLNIARKIAVQAKAALNDEDWGFVTESISMLAKRYRKETDEETYIELNNLCRTD